MADARVGLAWSPDFVFVDTLLAVFVDGCFWHGCQRCLKASKSNVEFWQNKIIVNLHRDIRVSRQLRASGWSVLRIRECELKDPLMRAKHLLIIESRLRNRARKR